VRARLAAAGGWNGSECKIFDIRHTQENKGLMKPVDELQGHTGLISSICFSPVTGNKIATICSDKRMRIYEVGKNQTAPYVVMFQKTPPPYNDNPSCVGLQAVWYPKREDLLVVGSMKQPRRINVISDKAIPHPPLEIANMESICSLVKCHPSQNIVVGGSNLGSVHVFM
jgi:WD40 repeat protein